MIKRIVIFIFSVMVGWFSVDLIFNGTGSFPGPVAEHTSSPGIDAKSHLITKIKKEKESQFKPHSAPAEQKQLADQQPNPEKGPADITATDPLEGFDFAVTLDEITSAVGDSSNGVAVRSLLSLWAKRAPAAALEWAITDFENNADPETDEFSDKDETLRMVLARIVEQDADTAGQVIKAMPSGDLRNRLVVDYVREFGISDSPTSAEAWVESIEDPEVRQQGMFAVAEVYASEDPYSFLNFVEEKQKELDPDGDGVFIREMMRQAANNIGQEVIFEGEPDDIVAGTEELSKYPEDVRAGIAEGMISRIMDEKPEAIDQLMENIPQGDFRDQAIEQFVKNGHSGNVTDYDRLVDLAASMENRDKMSMTAAMLLNRMQEDYHLRNNKRNKGGDGLKSDKVTQRLMALILHGVM